MGQVQIRGAGGAGDTLTSASADFAGNVSVFVRHTRSTRLISLPGKSPNLQTS